MLTLTIVRHAKSSWEEPSRKDIERPLNDRGRMQTEKMAKYLSEAKVDPDLILCSTAKRARQTLNRLLKVWNTGAEVILDGRLYMASADATMKLIEACSKKQGHIMVVGHNPGLHMLAYSLAKNGKPEFLKAIADKFPTLGIVTMQFAADKWKNLENGELVNYVTPKMIAD